MKKLPATILLLLALTASAPGQTPIKIYTSPKLPMRDAMERMNLVVAWNTRVAVDGNRDGVFSVQLIPGAQNHLVVQTYKGGVFVYDADNGDLIWKNMVGVPYWTPQPVGHNSQSLFVTRRNMLYILNRRDGSHRVYTFDVVTQQAKYGYDMGFAPNSGLVADESFLYYSVGDRVNALYVPDYDWIERTQKLQAKLKSEGKSTAVDDQDLLPEGPDSAQPSHYWSRRLVDQFATSAPLLYGDQVSILTTDGTLLSLDRLDRTQLEEIFAFKVNGKAPGAPGQHRNMAFVGSDDYNLYAINMYSGRLSWRYVAGAPILRGASANDYDVFVTPERSGLRRVDRVSGREAWINRDTERFLAANQYYIYGLDRFGKMNVIDGRRGTTLATHDLSDWAIAVPNEWTDRIYLAANDGQVLCMRHRENVKAVAMKTFEQPKAKEVKKAEPKKEEEKKEEEKKEEKKDDKDKAARLGRAPAAVDAEIRAARPREQNDPQIDALPMDQRLRARR